MPVKTTYYVDKLNLAESSLNEIVCPMPNGLRIVDFSLEVRNLPHSGGMFLIHRFCKELRLKCNLQKGIHFSQRSTYFHPVDVILAIIYALIAGIHPLSKTKVLLRNGTFRQVIALKKCLYASSLRRFLKRVDPKVIQKITNVLDRMRRGMFYLPRRLPGAVVIKQ